MKKRTLVAVAAVVVVAAGVIFSIVQRDAEPEPPGTPRNEPAPELPADPPPAPEFEVGEPEPMPELEPEPMEPAAPSPAEEAGPARREEERPPGVSLSGWLQGSGGQPLSSGEVMVLRLDGSGFRRSGPIAETGAFRIDGLDEGEYAILVRIGAQDHQPLSEPIAIGPDGVEGLQLRLPGRSSISGKIVGDTGPHAPELIVRRWKEGEWDWVATCRPKRDHTFTLSHLAAGRYRLRATGGVKGGHTKRHELELRDGEELAGVELHWTRGQEVGLVLRDAGGAPYLDPVRVICHSLTDGNLRLHRRRPDETGRLSLSFAPGKYRLTVERVTGGGKAAQLELEVVTGKDREVPVRFE